MRAAPRNWTAIAVKTEVASVIDTGGGKVESLLVNEGRTAQIWITCNGGLHMFAVYFWHSEAWRARSEALMQAVVTNTRDTRIRDSLLVMPTRSQILSCKDSRLVKEI